MTTTAAFQPDAFQLDAFQSEITQAGNIGGGSRHYYEPPEQITLKRSYEDLIRIAPQNTAAKIIGAVDPYMLPQNQEEYERRRNLRPISDLLPEVDRIDFDGLFNNLIARARLERIISTIRQQQEDEEEVVMLLLLTQ